MTVHHGFEKLRRQEIPELRARADIYRHIGSGAELLSLVCEDENKVFGISFRTPPSDSTGLPHILEHSVLCGSRKYPVKEPFVELLKGSLQTFLNAFTYPDKTCYPVASQNLQDFYNLIDIYLDAVFYPRLTPQVFQQEGWHYEVEAPDAPLAYKGVVFNEMKGVYSSPDSILAEYSQQSLFPDTPYGLDSGGNPKVIPRLTFEQFKAFHETYYHPSNARIFFYGDDDPERRLEILDNYLREFTPLPVDSGIPLQQPFDAPRKRTRAFASGSGDGGTGAMVTLNWLLPESTGAETNMALHMLDFILLGMAGSPLRKALIESQLGEDLAGGGLSSELRQMFFSIGLKGIDPSRADRVEALIQETLQRLVDEGIDPGNVEAALNTLEFTLRENNTANFPRGLVIMLRALNSWLYDADPLALVAFEAPLRAVKEAVRSDSRYFENWIEKAFLRNPHRTTLLLEPDPGLGEREEREEKEGLERVRSELGPAGIQEAVETTRELKRIQETPDPPEALARIPSLALSDLERRNRTIPLEVTGAGSTPVLYHDLFTNGIVYVDVGFNLHTLPPRFLPYVHLFGRALLEMGTEAEDYVSLTQRISRKTGGLRPAYQTSLVKGTGKAGAWMFLRGKAMVPRTGDLLDILRDVLLTPRLDNRDRFLQMVLESKARREQQLIPSGHRVVDLRLRAHFNEGDWAAEQMSGLSTLFFLRDLVKTVEEDWPAVLRDLEEMRRLLIDRAAMIVNVTLDAANWKTVQPQLADLMSALPRAGGGIAEWGGGQDPNHEGLIVPSQVNYVGKALGLYTEGYRFHGSTHVICRYLRNSWLWDRVRVQGGAYGAFCLFDRMSGVLSLVSYRDPNLEKTLEAFDASSDFLKTRDLGAEELTKAIIGTIGDIDRYQLPDAKGYTSLGRYLTGETDEERQRVREEVLGTSAEDFRAFARILETFRDRGVVAVLGSEGAITRAAGEEGIRLEPKKVL